MSKEMQCVRAAIEECVEPAVGEGEVVDGVDVLAQHLHTGHESRHARDQQIPVRRQVVLCRVLQISEDVSEDEGESMSW
jgi:hypothetical protein